MQGLWVVQRWVKCSWGLKGQHLHRSARESVGTGRLPQSISSVYTKRPIMHKGTYIKNRTKDTNAVFAVRHRNIYATMTNTHREETVACWSVSPSGYKKTIFIIYKNKSRNVR